MGLFDKMFKSERDIAKEEINKIPWNDLNDLEILDRIVEESRTQPVAILKHSTTCGISRMVLRQFEKDYDHKDENVKLYFLDLLRYREISNRIASRFNVPHESPQLLVIKEGTAVYDASHNEITVEGLSRAV
mgnify:CR=1 FL=1